MGDLTKKQLNFVREFLVDGDGAAAAERAGYRAKGAELLLANPKVLGRIAAELGRKKPVDAEKKRVQDFLLEIYEDCAVRVPKLDFQGEQMVDSDGNPVFELADVRGAMGALKELAGLEAKDDAKVLGGMIATLWDEGDEYV